MSDVGTDGLINLYKPAGITSAKALYRVRKITGVRKSGHTGTLDPAAEGVLVLCLGRATKLVEKVMSLPKVYRATVRLGVTSATLDSEGPLEPVTVGAIPAESDVRAALGRFCGPIQQVPPQVSAIKIGGVASYKLVRQGKNPTLNPRPVKIYWICLHGYAWPTVDIEMACGRGTYVRSLVRDLGKRLGTGGCLAHLTRVAVGPFHVKAAAGFDALQTPTGTRYILPAQEAVQLLEREAGRIPPAPPGSQAWACSAPHRP